jgi:hypothetical protein
MIFDEDTYHMVQIDTESRHEYASDSDYRWASLSKHLRTPPLLRAPFGWARGYRRLLHWSIPALFPGGTPFVAPVQPRPVNTLRATRRRRIRIRYGHTAEPSWPSFTKAQDSQQTFQSNPSHALATWNRQSWATVSTRSMSAESPSSTATRDTAS